MMELHEKIAAMREYIIEHGWCKWELEDTQGLVCIVGADINTPWLWTACVGSFLSSLAIELGLIGAYSLLITPSDGEAHYTPSDANIAFNNHPDTTEQDVIDFLHTAEIRAKELL